uniref:Uncharacterized protein n=1 Tax=viral metagenome TaxID=1070528 RepID=A0A6M3KS31_9ZZZZ
MDEQIRILQEQVRTLREKIIRYRYASGDPLTMDATTARDLLCVDKDEDLVIALAGLDNPKVFMTSGGRVRIAGEDSIAEVFAAWGIARAAFLARDGRKLTTVKMTNPRRRAIRARLKEGFSVETVKQAAAGIFLSVWHVENGFTDLTHVCKSAANVERFAALVAEPTLEVSGGLLDRINLAGRR